MKKITREYVNGLLPPAKRDVHKGTAGRVLIIAGSPGMAGAAVLATGAALRSGAGLVYVSADERIWPIIQTHEPCAVCIGRYVWDGVGSGATSEVTASGGEAARQRPHCARRSAARMRAVHLGSSPRSDALPEINDGGALLENYDAIAIGPGLGTSDETSALVDFVIENYEGTLVIDADALNIIADGRATLNCKTVDCRAATDREVNGGVVPLDRETPNRNNTIITPHPGEAARLLGVSVGEIQSDRKTAVAMLAEKYKAVAVLKGHRTLIATPEAVSAGMDVSSDPTKKSDMIFENATGNPGMATGGSGDVLTGVIASFAARGMSALGAATAGVYIHGLAGDIAAEGQGEYGLIATDIVQALPAAIKQAAQ